jgi:hypothetical protein
MRTRIFSLILLSAIAGCSSPPAIIPQSAPRPQAAPPIKQAPLPVSRPAGEWTDWPIAQGSWVYRADDRGSIALFGLEQGDAMVTIRCDRARGRIYLARADAAGTGGGAMTVRTSSALKTLNASPTGGTPAYIAAEIMPADPFLDAIIYTRGRIALQGNNQQSIAIPVWSEIAKVVEDCRS